MPFPYSSSRLRRHLTHFAGRFLRPLWLACAATALVGPAALAQGTDTPPAGYTRCAGEGQACSFSGAAHVVYGAKTSWSTPRNFTNGTACSNAVFGDPLFNTVKSCYYQPGAAPPPPPPPPPVSLDTPPAGYAQCAAEGKFCGFNGTADVVYGARTSWSSPRSFTGGTACTNAIFGDPLFNTVKSCYYKPAATPQFALGLAINGKGTVGLSDGSSCSSNCSKPFNAGSSVTLVAQAPAGYSFGGWGGACAGTSASCVVAMTAAKNVSALFTAAPTTQTLGLTIAGEGTGAVGFSDGASCVTHCNKTAPTGTSLTLVASPASGSTFSGWGGACSGTSACTVAMTAARSVTATFALAPAPLPSAAAARLFYSDLDGGPTTGGLNNKGAFVAIYGKNFGATRGTSTVKVGGGAVDNYLSWSDTKIVVQLGAAAQTGYITVTNASGQESSNGVWFTVRTGPIYFVTPNGNGNGAYATPMSPVALLSNMTPGAIFYFRGGTYDKGYGSSYGRNYALGQSARGVAFIGHPNEVATLVAPAGQGRHNFTLSADDGVAANVTIANFVLRGEAGAVTHGGITDAGGQVYNSGAQNVRVVGNVISANYTGNTMTGLINVGGHGARVYGNELKDTGTTPPINNNHAIYIQLGASDVDIGWNHLHDLRMGHTIQVHTDKAFKYEGVRIHDNVMSAAHINDSRGINMGNVLPGTNGSVYNNTLSNLGQGFSAIIMGVGDWDVYNNTLYNISVASDYALITQWGTPDGKARIRNNILYSDGVSNYVNVYNGSNSQITVENNLYFNKGGVPAIDKTGVYGNPLFINPTMGNFRLQPISPAINKGSAAVPAGAYRDGDGIARPQQGAFDIGAFEYAP